MRDILEANAGTNGSILRYFYKDHPYQGWSLGAFETFEIEKEGLIPIDVNNALVEIISEQTIHEIPQFSIASTDVLGEDFYFVCKKAAMQIARTAMRATGDTIWITENTKSKVDMEEWDILNIGRNVSEFEFVVTDSIPDDIVLVNYTAITNGVFPKERDKALIKYMDKYYSPHQRLHWSDYFGVIRLT